MTTILTYSISAKDQRAFHMRYEVELAESWAPLNGYMGLRAMLAIGFGAVVFGLIPQIERAMIVFVLSLFLFWVFQAAVEKITDVYYLRFLEGLPGIENNRTWMDEDYLTNESRGLRLGYPLSEASSLSTDPSFICIDFFKLGRVRIPLSAFPSDDAREEFQMTIKEKIKRNLAARSGGGDSPASDPSA